MDSSDHLIHVYVYIPYSRARKELQKLSTVETTYNFTLTVRTAGEDWGHCISVLRTTGRQGSRPREWKEDWKDSPSSRECDSTGRADEAPASYITIPIIISTSTIIPQFHHHIIIFLSSWSPSPAPLSLVSSPSSSFYHRDHPPWPHIFTIYP